jgi:hypothetical protein
MLGSQVRPVLASYELKPNYSLVTLRRSMLQVCVTTEFLNGTPSHSALLSEIYQVTGPVERFAGQIASQGYVVGQ